MSQFKSPEQDPINKVKRLAIYPDVLYSKTSKIHSEHTHIHNCIIRKKQNGQFIQKNPIGQNM